MNSRPYDDDVTPTKPLSPAEISIVQEIGGMLDRQMSSIATMLEARNAEWERRLKRSEETSASMLKMPRSRDRWRLIALLAGSLGLGSGGAYAGTAGLVERYEATVAEQALAEKEAHELAKATAAHLATPHQDPAGAAALAESLDRLDRRLAVIEDRLERLETRRR